MKTLDVVNKGSPGYEAQGGQLCHKTQEYYFFCHLEIMVTTWTDTLMKVKMTTMLLKLIINRIEWTFTQRHKNLWKKRMRIMKMHQIT